MDKIDEIDFGALKKAVLAWTGYKSATYPDRTETALNDAFSSDEISKLMPIVIAFEEAFYESQAHLTAPSLEEMGKIAKAEFLAKYPNLPVEVADAFAWCYTFDYK